MKTLVEDIDLSRKVALVNGSSAGIGRACAQVIASQGAHVILVARNEEKLKETLSLLDESKGQSHFYIVADHSKGEEFIQTLLKNLEEKNLSIDVLVNNSGGPSGGALLSANTDDLESAFRNHILTNQRLSKVCVPQMEAKGFGRIINILSTSVKVPIKNLGVSNLTRAAVASWAKTLSNEVSSKGITVNSVLPGFTETERLQNLAKQGAENQDVSLQTFLEKWKESIPMKRFASAEEIAKVVGFLASPAASYVNGVSLRVDGGRTGSI